MCMRSGRVTIATVALSTVFADQSNTLAVDIPAQPLAAALVELGEETGLRVVGSDRLLKGKMSPGAKGVMTPSTVLESILAGSGLSVRALDDSEDFRTSVRFRRNLGLSKS